MLYADDLVLTSDTMEGLHLKLKTWRKAMESKGLRVNVAKTKVMQCWKAPREEKVLLLSFWKGSGEQLYIIFVVLVSIEYCK